MDSTRTPYPLRIRLAAAVIAAALALAIGYYSLVPPGEAPAPQISDKIRHFGAYAMLAIPVAMALAPRRLLPLGLAASYGALLEAAQAYAGTGREASFADGAANILGASAGVLFIWWIARRRG